MEVFNLPEAADPSADPKRARILDGAMKVFLTYGFSRTTMDDIARAAEVSRPALYLLFRNKTDIYRAIATGLLAQSVEIARAALAGDGPFGERMMAMVERAMIGLMTAIEASPHGAEIMDMKTSLAADTLGEWRERLVDLMAAAIEAEAARLGTELSAQGIDSQTLAGFVFDGLEGLKTRGGGAAAKREGARHLVRVVELTIRP